MKICIPTNGNKGFEEKVGEHFGRVPFYTVVDTDTNSIETLSNTSEHMGGQGYPPDIMIKAGVDVMLCAGLGNKARRMFEVNGIMVFIGAYGNIQKAIDMWEKNLLQAATDENICREHAFSEHKHHVEE